MKRAALAILVIAVGARLVYGRGTLGFDAAWALEWGDQMAHGALPQLDAPGTPTPHPLAIIVSAVLAPLGPTAIELVLALSWLALGAVGWFAFRLGAELYSPWVGGLFAALLLTRPLIVLEAGQAVIDIPFLALVLAALVAEIRAPRHGFTVPVLLGVAGLLRPEAWLLAIVWAAWALPARRDRAAVIAATLAAPLLWIAFDLLATGDPLHSLHGTQSLAARLERPRELDTALRSTPGYLRVALTEPVIWLGLAGAALAITRLRDRTVLPAAVAGLGLLAFLVLGATGLPLLSRYLLLPASLLALWAAVAALGFSVAGGRVWILAAVVAFVVLVAGLPGLRDELQLVTGVVEDRAAVEQGLTAIVAGLPRCGALSVPDDRPYPLARFLVDAPVTIRGNGVIVNYATAEARAVYRIGPAPPPGLPAGSRPLAANETWIASAARSCAR